MSNDDWKNFTPRANPPKTVEPSDKDTLSVSDIALLECLSKDELIKIIKKVSSAGWGNGQLSGKDLITSALMSDDEVYEALMLRGQTLALNSKAWNEFLGLATWWTDRKKGKPVGSSSNIVIGANGGDMEVRVILVSPNENNQNVKIIDNNA